MNHKNRKGWRRASIVVAAGVLFGALAGCSFGGSSDDSTTTSDSIRISMLPVSTLDPAIAGNSSFGQIMMIGLWEGLVVVDKENPLQVAAGAAESWEVSDDGLIYTFHLREGAKWSNGDPVTAADFEWNFKRILTPGVAGEGAPSYNSAIGISGAASYLSGATDDFSTVGAKAVDEGTFEITLDKPNADLLIQLAQYWALPLHPGTVEEFGNDWAKPENWVSNGAYTLSSFTVNQGATMVRNDEYWDTGEYPISEVDVTFNDGGTTADLLAYQQGELDITGRIEDDLDAVTSSDVGSELVSSPTNQVRQLVAMTSENTVLEDVRVRQALAEAIDREAVAAVAQPAVAGTSLVPAAVKQSSDFAPIPSDVDSAKELLAEAGYEGGEGMPTITLLDYQRSPWVEAVAQMWRDNLGLDVVIDVQEVGVYGTKRAELHGADYVGFYVQTGAFNPPTLLSNALIARVSAPALDGINMLQVDAAREYLAAKEGGADAAALDAIVNSGRLPENAEVITLTDAALSETDPEAQLKLLAEAQTARNATYNTIPVLWGGYNLLVKPTVKNLEPWYYGSVYTLKGVSVEN